MSSDVEGLATAAHGSILGVQLHCICARSVNSALTKRFAEGYQGQEHLLLNHGAAIAIANSSRMKTVSGDTFLLLDGTRGPALITPGMKWYLSLREWIFRGVSSHFAALIVVQLSSGRAINACRAQHPTVPLPTPPIN